MVFGMFLFLLNVAFAPVSLFTSPALGLPIQIKFMIATPLGIIFILLIIGYMRGGSD